MHTYNYGKLPHMRMILGICNHSRSHYSWTMQKRRGDSQPQNICSWREKNYTHTHTLWKICLCLFTICMSWMCMCMLLQFTLLLMHIYSDRKFHCSALADASFVKRISTMKLTALTNINNTNWMQANVTFLWKIRKIFGTVTNLDDYMSFVHSLNFSKNEKKNFNIPQRVSACDIANKFERKAMPSILGCCCCCSPFCFFVPFLHHVYFECNDLIYCPKVYISHIHFVFLRGPLSRAYDRMAGWLTG